MMGVSKLTIDLFITSKRRNSTARPSSSGISIQAVLKMTTSVLNPVFRVSGDINELLLYNEIRWEGRYYFIDDIIEMTNNIVEIHCSVDVLATYRTEIGNYTAFVERSSSKFDLWITDLLLSNRLADIYTKEVTSGQLPHWSFSGTFVIRTCGQGATASSIGITSYAVSASQLKSVLDFMFSDGNFDFLTDTSVKAFFNPFQYILSVMWFPFDQSAFGSTQGTVKFGWWDSGVSSTVVTETAVIWSVDLAMPESVYDDFRGYDERFTTLKIQLPGCGTYFLNPIEVYAGLHVTYSIDIATGEALVRIFSNGYLAGTFSGMMASSVAIGQLQTHEVSAGQSAITAIGKLFQLDIAGALNDAIDVHTSIAQPTPCVNGSAGNMGSILSTQRIGLYRIDYGSADFPQNVLGRPLNRNVLLSTLSGYIKCAGASVPLESLSSERTLVNQFLNGGFYYE